MVQRLVAEFFWHTLQQASQPMRKAKWLTQTGTGLAVIDDTHLNSEPFYKEL